jgi:hypothetical protein
MREYEQADMDGVISMPIHSSELYKIIGTFLKNQL